MVCDQNARHALPPVFIRAMPQVDFHILTQAGDDARLRQVCLLIEQAQETGQRVYVRAGSDAEAQRLDDLLWTFKDQAFIPHGVTGASTAHTRDVASIGTQIEAPEGFTQLLINLQHPLPDTVQQFERICEVVDAEPLRKQQARERYKQYRELGCELNTINH